MSIQYMCVCVPFCPPLPSPSSSLTHSLPLIYPLPRLVRLLWTERYKSKPDIWKSAHWKTKHLQCKRRHFFKWHPLLFHSETNTSPALQVQSKADVAKHFVFHLIFTASHPLIEKWLLQLSFCCLSCSVLSPLSGGTEQITYNLWGVLVGGEVKRDWWGGIVLCIWDLKAPLLPS